MLHSKQRLRSEEQQNDTLHTGITRLATANGEEIMLFFKITYKTNKQKKKNQVNMTQYNHI